MGRFVYAVLPGGGRNSNVSSSNLHLETYLDHEDHLGETVPGKCPVGWKMQAPRIVPPYPVIHFACRDRSQLPASQLMSEFASLNMRNLPDRKNHRAIDGSRLP